MAILAPHMTRSLLSLPLCQIRQLAAEELQARLRAAAPAEQTGEQLLAWDETVVALKEVFTGTSYSGHVFFEFAVPRLGSRIDVVVVVRHVVFVLEFKTGAGTTLQFAVDQVTDYALDLRYFHTSSHNAVLAPVLVTEASRAVPEVRIEERDGRLLMAAVSSFKHLRTYIEHVLKSVNGAPIDPLSWENGVYEPTPTIIEAARALYRGHNVSEITRTTAGAGSLTTTADTLLDVIGTTMNRREKAICFVTGVPGAGKTLIGLNLATKKIGKHTKQHCVYLSGNAPLVAVLREALTRDAVAQHKLRGERVTKVKAGQSVKSFIQNVHHFRDDGVRTLDAPTEHIAVFDEAQRAWNREMTKQFMSTKKGVKDFDHSEPEFLISCMDRHKDWAVIVCLVGNGQEINRGEAGIAEWLRACRAKFPAWKVYASSHLSLSEEEAAAPLKELQESGSLTNKPALHLTASVRSFRSESLSTFVNALLRFDPLAGKLLSEVTQKFPMYLTRDVSTAKAWVREQARGSERYGILASSAAQRLRPYAIDVTSKINPVHWFLNDKRDVRSSYFLETVATEFDVQGLELDYTFIAWDADFRCASREGRWHQYAFRGDRWENVRNAERRAYQVNAYRVLLTRARQGMVICVPSGSPADHTRQPSFYDGTYEYLKEIGMMEV